MEWKKLFNNIQGQSQARAHATKILAYLTGQVNFPNHDIRDSTNLNEHSHEYLQHREDRVVPIITQENTRDKIHINKQRFFRAVAVLWNYDDSSRKQRAARSRLAGYGTLYRMK